MKCLLCDGKGGFWNSFGTWTGPCFPCHSRGWYSFWSPSERAGLKAMGAALRRIKLVNEYLQFSGELHEHISIIRDYVSAARKIKEGVRGTV